MQIVTNIQVHYFVLKEGITTEKWGGVCLLFMYLVWQKTRSIVNGGKFSNIFKIPLKDGWHIKDKLL